MINNKPFTPQNLQSSLQSSSIDGAGKDSLHNFDKSKQSNSDLEQSKSGIHQQNCYEDLQLSIIEDKGLKYYKQLSKKKSFCSQTKPQDNKQNTILNKKMTISDIKKNNIGRNCCNFLFCSQIPLIAKTETRYLSLNNLKTKSSHLDILLFKNGNNMSKLQRFFTGSQFDHVAMIVQISNHKFIIESNYQHGVCLCDFQKFVQSLIENKISGIKPNYQLGYRRFLSQKYTSDQKQKIYQKSSKFIQRVLGKPFRFNPIYLISQQYQKKQQTYFCSQLIAEFLQFINLIKLQKPSFSILPSNFSPKTYVSSGVDIQIRSRNVKQIDIISGIFQRTKIVDLNPAISDSNRVL